MGIAMETDPGEVTKPIIQDTGVLMHIIDKTAIAN